MEKVGAEVFVGGLAASLVMLLLTLFCFSAPVPDGSFGICLPSPAAWHLPKFGSWLAGAILIYIAAAILTSANKRFNFISSPDNIPAVMLPLLIASSSATTFFLSSSTMLMAVNVIGIFILFSTYDSRDTAKEYFVIASLLSIGTMFQYAFLMMVPVFLLGGLLMKSFQLRQLIAFLFGLAAPYWIAFGLGWIPLDRLSWPDSFHVVDFGDNPYAKAVLTAECIMGAVAFCLALYNAMRLLNRNSQLRCMHFAIDIMGFISALCILFDSHNFGAYFGTIALWLSVEAALLFELYDVRATALWSLVIFSPFLTLYIVAL